MPLATRIVYPAGVIVYGGETAEQAFRRHELELARACWIAAAEEVADLAAATPWWDDVLPDGRT